MILRAVEVMAASAEPITLAEAKKQCGDDAVFFSGSPSQAGVSDDLYRIWITAARRSAEQFTGLKFTDATYEMRTSDLCASIVLPAWVREIVSVTYLDDAGVRQLLADTEYVLDLDGLDDGCPVRLVPATGITWPHAPAGPGAVRIRARGEYSAGGSPQVPVPAEARTAMLLTIGHLFENRGEKDVPMPSAAGMLLRPLRVLTGFA